MLGTDASLVGLAQRVGERTGGNPFYMEEVVQSLVEEGALQGKGGVPSGAPGRDWTIPPTVHGILTARIDRLPEREKSVLQTAAAIGLKFSEPLLRRVCNLSQDDLEGAVSALRRAELIHEESLYPEVEYAFRHPLTHEVAERSRLAAQRRRVHVAVARALEELHADKPDENAALLAHHWDFGGEAAPAARWYRRAAEWIAGSNSAEARRHWNRVRELAEQVGDAALALELGQQSRLMILEYGWRLGVTEAEADELLHEGEVWARRNDDPRALAALYNAFSVPCLFLAPAIRGVPASSRRRGSVSPRRRATPCWRAPSSCGCSSFASGSASSLPCPRRWKRCCVTHARMWSGHRRSWATTSQPPWLASVDGRTCTWGNWTWASTISVAASPWRGRTVPWR